MTLIATLLPPENVAINVAVSSKKRLFEHLGLLFENNHGIASSTVFDCLFVRERLGSTGLGHGIAIPHGRIKGMKDAHGALLRLAAPVPFEAPDSKPVIIVFALLVPEQATERHLQVLSELAQMFSDHALRDEIAAAPDACTLHNLVSTWQPDAPGKRHATA